MKCSNCGSNQVNVYTHEIIEDAVLRGYNCLECQNHIKTITTPLPLVVGD